MTFLSRRIIDFGPIRSGDTAIIDVAFQNTGDEPLQLRHPITTCNCTSVSYPREAISPGEKNSVKIKIDTKGKAGKETVVVKLHSNAKEQYSVIRIDINVLSKK